MAAKGVVAAGGVCTRCAVALMNSFHVLQNFLAGEVSVFLTEEKTLDRERDQEWELNFRARDHCPADGQDTKCEGE